MPASIRKQNIDPQIALPRASLRLSHQGDIALLEFTRPERLNALDETLGAALVDALASVQGLRQAKALLICAEGANFMAGGDLKAFANDFPAAPATAARVIERLNRAVALIRDLPIPVICALQGAVAGGGLSIALACDLVLASEDARLVPAYARIASSPDGGMSWSLAQALGPRRALQWLLLGDPLTAQEALHWGLVDRVLSPEALRDDALRLAQRLARGPREAHARIKRLVYAAPLRSFSTQRDKERLAFVAGADSDDFREGISSFLERRTPQFK